MWRMSAAALIEEGHLLGDSLPAASDGQFDGSTLAGINEIRKSSLSVYRLAVDGENYVAWENIGQATSLKNAIASAPS